MMRGTNALTKSSTNQNRRRRQLPNRYQNSSTCDGDSYDNDDDDDDKGHRRHENRIFKGSCSLGQFVLNPCRCLLQAATSYIQRFLSYFRRKGRLAAISDIEKKTATATLLIIIMFFLSLLGLQVPGLGPDRLLSSSWSWSSSARIGRPLTDQALDQIRIKISRIEEKIEEDLGGWKGSRQRFFHPTVPLRIKKKKKHDFGQLSMRIKNRPKPSHGSDENNALLNRNHNMLPPPRIINPNDEEGASRLWEKLVKDTPKHLDSWYAFPEDVQDRTKARKCRFPSFIQKYKPSCNMVHEVSLGDNYNAEKAWTPSHSQPNDSYYLSYGAFRIVFGIHQPFPNNVTSVLKMTRFKLSFNYEHFAQIMNDAMVMEALTGSPRIVDIYSHCGGTVWVEGLPYEVEEVIIYQKTDGMMKPENLPKELTPFNNYTVEEKLDLALAMAESLADLHGFRDGVIVHNDVQLCQWLKNSEGRLKFGDFNRAGAMEYNEKNGDYCKYDEGGAMGNYRSPEEYKSILLNEKIDVYSFGNNIYGLLTGLWVFYDIDDDGVVQKKAKRGGRAYIDPRWRERSFIETKLVELMEKCWIQNVDERIDIFGAVKELREIKKEHERRKTKNAVAGK